MKPPSRARRIRRRDCWLTCSMSRVGSSMTASPSRPSLAAWRLLRALVGQAPCRHRQAAHEGGLDHQPEQQQVQGVDQPVGEFERGVVVAEAHGDEQGDGQGGEGHAHRLAEQRGVAVGRAAEQQAAEQPGHQGIAGQHHADAQHVVGQRRRLVLGHRHHADQRQHHGAQAADPAAQELDLRLVPAEVRSATPPGRGCGRRCRTPARPGPVAAARRPGWRSARGRRSAGRSCTAPGQG
jgi:hypothetical protein